METKTTNIFDRPMTFLSRVTLSAEEQNDYNIKTDTIGNFLAPQRQYQYIEQIQDIREGTDNKTVKTACH